MNPVILRNWKLVEQIAETIALSGKEFLSDSETEFLNRHSDLEKLVATLTESILRDAPLHEHHVLRQEPCPTFVTVAKTCLVADRTRLTEDQKEQEAELELAAVGTEEPSWS